jgi:NAD+ kinase
MRRWEDDVRILVVPNAANPRSVTAAGSVCARLAAMGYEPVLLAADADACDLASFGVAHADIGTPELAVALGGDGTILKAVHLLGPSTVPILGINLGRLGFLSGADGGELVAALESALAGEGKVERRQTIEASVSMGGRSVGVYRALNEVFVGRGGGSRGVEVAIDVNGQRLAQYVCDGVIVATPTGSTAYALSAGGPLVSPEVRGMVLLPVAAHALGVRPMVLGPCDAVRISCPNSARADAGVSVDGDQVPARSALDAVEVKVGENDVHLLRLDGRDFYGTLARTFLGG